ncbi:unnamed protein product [Paramecium sonneborni]|uniref:Uncharacterized protein n=1 Tax=Paramecium sonneborni TaxID=65129 RepID=A0A8S1MKQ8_9CILI|nr:unnamed protein product [Paramecium sonneborni]
MSTDIKRQQNFSRAQTTNINKAAEQWIIDTLAMDVRFKTMEEVGISRHQLMGRGLKKDTIDRIYKGLYVYSKGFNELLNQCIGEDILLVKGLIWKVFLILLERYNSSDYQMIIQQLIEQHFKEVKQVIKDNEVIGIQNQDLQNKLLEQSEKQEEQIQNHNKIEQNLKNQLDILNNRYLLADDAAERELEKRFRLENKTGLIRQQFSELVCKQQLLLDELQYLNKQLKQKQNQNEDLLEERQNFLKRIEKLNEENNLLKISIIDYTSTVSLKNQLLKNSDELISKLQNQIIKQQHQATTFVTNPFLQLKQRDDELQQQEEEKLRQENQELRNRIMVYQQQIDMYIQQKSQDLLNQIKLLEDSLSKLKKSNQELQDKYFNKKQKLSNLKHQFNSLLVAQEITKGNLDINVKKVENLENANSFQIVNNSTLSQYVERLTNCINKMEQNEKILNDRIHSQFQTIQNLSQQVEVTSRQNQQKLDNLNQLLLQKSIQNDELQLLYKDLKQSHQVMQEQYQKEVLSQQVQNEELKQKIQNQDITIYKLEQNETQLKFELENQTKQYQEYLLKKEEQARQIIDQGSKIRKLEKDNARINQELNWITNQNQGFSDKIKKQQLIIREIQKELDQVKGDYSQAQREFEDMKFDYDEQMIFYQQNIQSLVKQRKEFEEDLVIKQFTISKQAQIMADQDEKLKRQEINLMNKDQDMKIIEEKLMLESQKFNNYVIQKEEQSDQPDKSTILSQNIQDIIQKKLIQKIKLKRQQQQQQQQGNSNLITIIDSIENDNSIQEIIEHQLQNDSTLENLLNSIVDGVRNQSSSTQQLQNYGFQKQQNQQQKSQGVLQTQNQAKQKPNQFGFKPIKPLPQFKQQETIEILPQILTKSNNDIVSNQSSRNKTIKSSQKRPSRSMQKSETAQNYKSLQQNQSYQSDGNLIQQQNYPKNQNNQGNVDTSFQETGQFPTQFMQLTYQGGEQQFINFKTISESELQGDGENQDQRKQSQLKTRKGSISKSKQFTQLYRVVADYYTQSQ